MNISYELALRFEKGFGSTLCHDIIQADFSTKAGVYKYISEDKPSTIFILVDENTNNDCLPLLLEQLETEQPIEIIEIESGEVNKNLDTCSGV